MPKLFKIFIDLSSLLDRKWGSKCKGIVIELTDVHACVHTLSYTHGLQFVGVKCWWHTINTIYRIWPGKFKLNMAFTVWNQYKENKISVPWKSKWYCVLWLHNRDRILSCNELQYRHLILIVIDVGNIMKDIRNIITQQKDCHNRRNWIKFYQNMKRRIYEHCNEEDSYLWVRSLKGEQVR